MPDILTDLSPASLAAAVKTNLYAFFRYLRSSPAATVHEDARRLRWLTAVPHPWFNGVLSMEAPAGDADQLVRSEIDHFRSQGVSALSWWLAPQLDPNEWSRVLLPHGFHFTDDTPGMAMDLHKLPEPAPAGLVIQTVADQPALAQWAQVFARGYGLPESLAPLYLELMNDLSPASPLRHYLGWLDDRPVAASTLYLAAGVAGLYNVATLPEARGRGVGTAMSLAPLHAGRELGYRVGVLQSSLMGYRVYERIGFREVCRMEYFFFTAAPQA